MSNDGRNELTDDLIHGLSKLMKSKEHTRSLTEKRDDFIAWEDYFMAAAYLAAMRSKDPNTQVGCVIVNTEQRIVGAGYNGMPNGIDDDKVPWARTAERPIDTKYPFVCHAEMNAIFNRNCFDLRGCRLYTTHFPCNECTKMILQARITEVVYVIDKHREETTYVASRIMMTQAGVKFRQHVPEASKIVIDFENMRAFKL
ncbi:deoxycytidylate deaminase-like [Ornithodoros turicata]|uniref:deoxycytidylate deaminase-like n=1 Tax=Ornithodoros turicata TaxID=34597 RepID=UPI00313A0556